MRCEKCGYELRGVEKYCPRCGCAIEQTRDKKNRKTAVLIVGAFFILTVILFLVFRAGRKPEKPSSAVAAGTREESTRVRETEPAAESAVMAAPETSVDAADSMQGRLTDEQKETLGNRMTGIETENHSAARPMDENAVEDEVQRIRKIYNEIQESYQNYTAVKDGVGRTIYRGGDYVKVTCPKGTEGNPWSSEYYFESGNLLFAFYFQGKTENRFYFYEGKMFRWIDDGKTIHDNEFDQDRWTEWETMVRNYEPGI